MGWPFVCEMVFKRCSLIIKVQDIVFQLHRFISTMSKYHTDCYESMKSSLIFIVINKLKIVSLRSFTASFNIFLRIFKNTTGYILRWSPKI